METVRESFSTFSRSVKSTNRCDERLRVECCKVRLATSKDGKGCRYSGSQALDVADDRTLDGGGVLDGSGVLDGGRVLNGGGVLDRDGTISESMSIVKFFLNIC